MRQPEKQEMPSFPRRNDDILGFVKGSAQKHTQPIIRQNTRLAAYHAPAQPLPPPKAA
ncbi:hypothetical protein GCWU000324_02254 [Kingella oralis ATCC 51147]|uniref:Uncharacterized protein n=1 Tax=Kingella oralis ATCC 51147 TaxID=629741 RepID=C4GJN1_9NEIS|nr:hypothetical protein GCWU000324_02254 [Kingella oralis ATCC 51147]